MRGLIERLDSIIGYAKETRCGLRLYRRESARSGTHSTRREAPDSAPRGRAKNATLPALRDPVNAQPRAVE